MIKVMNVNDREAARYMIGRMLRTGGFQVVDAVTGEEALELAVTERPAVMVLDIQLPGIDGLEVCRRLKDNPDTASIAVLQTSATFVGPEARVRGLEVGADGFLIQPFTTQELVATVNSLLRLQQRETAQADRAEALAEADRRKDDFLAMLAHELRNPVAAIATALELVSGGDRDARALAVARRQTRVLAGLVDDLLDMSRVSRGVIALRRERIDLLPLLRQVLATVEQGPVARRRQRLVSRLAGEPLWIDGDVLRLQQIFTNLLDNASKYTDSEGRIELRVERDTARDGSRWAVIRVRDNGIGIPSEALPRLFGLFYQAHASMARSAGGLGIGLTLVRNLTELHGGSVSVTSDGPDRGSEFVVRLPLAEAGEVRPERPPPAPSNGNGHPRRRILIVEDNEDNRETLKDLCERWNHEVHTARDGYEGVRVALEQCPDVAFIDIGLPGIDGYEVARRVRARLGPKQIRLVALSGYGEQADGSDFDHHLVKPASLARLSELLEK